MDLFDAMRTQRALRRLKPDPVPDELIWKILEAATGAPSGGNLQPWNFIVIRDADTKRRLHELYLDGMRHVTRPRPVSCSSVWWRKASLTGIETNLRSPTIRARRTAVP